MSAFVITQHAVDRYISRIKPGLNSKAARRELTESVRRATRLKEKTSQGHFLWRVESPAFFLITKRDNKQHIIVTIWGDLSEDVESEAPTTEKSPSVNQEQACVLCVDLMSLIDNSDRLYFQEKRKAEEARAKLTQAQEDIALLNHENLMLRRRLEHLDANRLRWVERAKEAEQALEDMRKKP